MWAAGGDPGRLGHLLSGPGGPGRSRPRAGRRAWRLKPRSNRREGKLAEEVQMFVREDWTLFRSLDTIGQKAGVPVGRLPELVLKELVDNALDCGGPCHFALLHTGDGFYVEDE